MNSKLQHFPVMMFAIIMGFSGLTIVYQKASSILGYPSFIGFILCLLTTIIFFSILSLYTLKIFKYFSEVKAEFAHPVRINFFAAISISFLLLAIIYEPISANISAFFWYIGAILQAYFTFYTISFWINKNLEIQHSNPAWFIPIVGNVLVPIAGVKIACIEVLVYFYAVGMFFWVILMAILLNRIIFHHQLVQKFMPTLFILIAPPAIGTISYVKIIGEFDFFASFLYSLGLFFTLLLLFMYKNFLKLKFFISWWAFTFPLAAVTISSLLAYHETHRVIYSYISQALIVATTIVIFLVFMQTFKHRGEICIPE
ncbi:MAG: tellurite resistance protein [Sulfurospirillum sp.]|jgi:tellurite resistance protein|nr:tellurite resistance protein [Sulfurospirillum sp.]DAB33334.1 MAG TPA: C4-dicarboxylate ABC transporter [Sulfurospirillum sp. UBA12182]